MSVGRIDACNTRIAYKVTIAGNQFRCLLRLGEGSGILVAKESRMVSYVRIENFRSVVEILHYS